MVTTSASSSESPALLPFPETVGDLADPAALFNAWLDGYRAVLLRKLDELSDDQLRSSVLPSGWTPLELLRHLAAMERRWIQQDFLGLPLDDPWPDWDQQADRWHVPAEVTADEVRQELNASALRTREVLAGTSLDTPAVHSRSEADTPPTLIAILFHVLQEYARHVGQLDVVRELIDGQTGE